MTQLFRLSFIELNNNIFPLLTDVNVNPFVPPPLTPTPIQTKNIWDGFAAKLKINAYSDNITCSHDLSILSSRDTSYNPCMNLLVNWNELTSLVKMVQLHSQCNISYCRRGRADSLCRFGFPKPLRSKTNISIIEKEDQLYPILSSSRNNRYINNYNPYQLALLKGNCDNQLILTIMNYITI